MIAFRVDGDKNLLDLVEAELGSRLLRAYLVDNAKDATVLSRFLSCFHFYRTQVSLGSDLWVRVSLTHSLTDTPFADLTDVTLADGDTNPILTDDANRTFQSNVAMQVTQPGSKWCHLVAEFATNATGAIWWSNL